LINFIVVETQPTSLKFS